MKGKERTEILCCFGNKIIVELKDDSACWDTCDRDIKVGDLSLGRHIHALHHLVQRQQFSISGHLCNQISKIRAATHMTSDDLSFPRFPAFSALVVDNGVCLYAV